MVALKLILIGILKKFGEALVGVVMDLLTKDLFEDVARKVIRRLLEFWKDSTTNTLDDEVVADVVKRLESPRGPE